MMSTLQDHASRNLVLLRGRVFHIDADIGQSLPHIAQEDFEFGRTVDVLIHFTETNRHGIGCHQLIDNLLAPLIPDFLKPAL